MCIYIYAGNELVKTNHPNHGTWRTSSGKRLQLVNWKIIMRKKTATAKSTISMGHGFNSKLSVYQKVYHVISEAIPHYIHY